MTLDPMHESDDEEFHSIRSPGLQSEHVAESASEEGEEDSESLMGPPAHPLPSLQGAFEESIVESTQGEDANNTLPEESDAERRRQNLLDMQRFDDSWTTRWKQRPGAEYHPLLKLMAQIVFGMHLLQQQQAKSNEEVVRILQTHVNEVDGFLERTAEDFDLAIVDIEERIRHLKLPMEHLDVFNIMLDDRNFRMQLLDGNDKIEKIIERTTRAMRAALMDVGHGIAATQELSKYLSGIKDLWPRGQGDIVNVLSAMRGNEQGWTKYLKDLKLKGSTLNRHLQKLGTVIGEMSRLAAAASRRNKPSSRPTSPPRSGPTSPPLQSKFSPEREDSLAIQRRQSLNKPLPQAPATLTGSLDGAGARAHPVPFAQRFEKPRQSPQSPPHHGWRTSSAPNGIPPRPRTAGAPRDAQVSRSNTLDLAEFLKHSGPLSSNPPEPEHASRNHRQLHEKAPRSHSQGAVDILNAVSTAEASNLRARSKTHGPTAVVLTNRPQSRDVDATSNRAESRGRDRAMSVKSMPASRKDSLSSVGFARRLSKRAKHMPPSGDRSQWRPGPQDHVNNLPADSSNPSGNDQQQPGDSQGAAPTQQAQKGLKRPPSRLALFPKTPEPGPPTPSLIPGQNIHDSWPIRDSNAPVLQSSTTAPPSIDSTQKSRGRSLKSFFQRKHKVQAA
ncbi:hypothetical protein KC351_g11662 [Hortaea werneckii]|nr:hypothetical protein KC351_g11662 [Hortaea werneckii]